MPSLGQHFFSTHLLLLGRLFTVDSGRLGLLQPTFTVSTAGDSDIIDDESEENNSDSGEIPPNTEAIEASRRALS